MSIASQARPSADAAFQPAAQPSGDEAAIEFRNVDILFAAGGRDGRRALREALVALDGGASRPGIHAKHGGIVSVAGASLSVARGEISVLMGLSGSGKSTLLRAANGLNRVTRGQVW